MGSTEASQTGSQGETPVGAAAARDYVYARLEELRADLASGPGVRRERAREERDFLEREFKRKLGGTRGTVRVDPRLARAMLGRGASGSAAPPREAARTVFPLKTRTGRTPTGRGIGPEAEGGPTGGPDGRPRSYWTPCEEMDFRGLREFIDVSLRTPPGPKTKKLPRAKQEFLDLLKLLAGKGEIELDGDLRPVADAEENDPKLRTMRARRKILAKALAQAQHDLSVPGRRNKNAPTKVRDLREELGRLGSQIGRLEATKKADLANPRTEKQKLRQLKARRTERVGRVRRDIERVFAEGGPGVGPSSDRGDGRVAGRRLPWRVLPPGELTLERVLAHYERLARERPGRRFEPERIEKALSLGPTGWWEGSEGSEGFGGYVVFEYPGTERVLLECGLYGNAIYVLGPDWKRLSRLSKRELLDGGSATRIVHVGAWFETLKLALRLR